MGPLVFDIFRKRWVLMDSSRLVYSTETGRVCPSCGKPVAKCSCKKKMRPQRPQGDGIVRIRREVKGRKGKTATVIYGFEADTVEIKKIGTQLKRLCGTGGSVKNDEIIIQGDHRETVKSELTRQGFQVKLAGG